MQTQSTFCLLFTPVAKRESPPVMTPAAIFAPETFLALTLASMVLWLLHLGQGGPDITGALGMELTFTVMGAAGAAAGGWENCCGGKNAWAGAGAMNPQLRHVPF